MYIEVAFAHRLQNPQERIQKKIKKKINILSI